MDTRTEIRAYVQEYSYIAMFSLDPSRPQPTCYRAMIEEVTERPEKAGLKMPPRIKRLAKGPERRTAAAAERDLTKLKAQHGIK